MATQTILISLEQYYDAVPRGGGARAEDFGPLTLFVQEGDGWAYYARPTLGGAEASVADVERVLARQRELEVPEAFEWVAENNPSLRASVEAAGLHVHAHPLMVLDTAEPLPPQPGAAHVLGADDPRLAAALTVPMLAFAARGTEVGEAGPAELAAATADPAVEVRRASIAAMIASGRTVMAAAERDGVVLCSGQYNPVGDVAEIVGVGTLPAARRQGLALAVTAALVTEALARGVRTVFLSAGDEDVARIYGRAGFRRVATALIAEPPAADGA
ncbi:MULTISPECIES: GNAT family N-acetyltransferase [unclassified Streptomyces]|uniref:GNAT family N-acetyltransferase n=1 Tax=unclassified Streptomyces TaxID=2593676 RepID=UPI002E3119D3|nr:MULTISPECIES: GNAT family N-acetyltransferase [unclassified Streptomyces]WUC66521.1 GNAT family N-acetyltransferase [Streptomyces sp. NBC_00539]